MSKKTRKKSTKSTSVPPTSRTTRKPAQKTKRAASKTSGASAAKQISKKAKGKAKDLTTKNAPAKKTSESKSSSSTPKSVSATKGAAAKKPATKKTGSRKTAPKTVITPIRMAATLAEGDTAPAFFLPRDGGQLVSLANYAGRKLVVFFYPRADTPGCTLEAVAFSRLSNAFAASQTAILGVSADPLKAQESFRDKHQLSVPLLSDEKLGMLKAYGVWGEKSMYGKTFMGISRTTVLIDANGKIARIWRNVKVDGHAEEVLTAARTA
ncbi:MAG: peroxiredoxin [Pseudomonadota bacterium]